MVDVTPPGGGYGMILPIHYIVKDRQEQGGMNLVSGAVPLHWEPVLQLVRQGPTLSAPPGALRESSNKLCHHAHISSCVIAFVTASPLK